MPISRQEFEEGRFDLSVPILQYMNVRSEEAFTSEEILEALFEIYGRRVTPAEVVIVLEDLVADGLVEMKQLAGMMLYAVIKGS